MSQGVLGNSAAGSWSLNHRPTNPPHAAGTSIQWGAWAGVGMAHTTPSVLARAEQAGLGLVTPGRGLEALKAVLRSSPDHGLATVSAHHARMPLCTHSQLCGDRHAARAYPFLASLHPPRS